MTDEERARDELPYTADGVVTGLQFVERFRDEAGLNLTPVAATILTRLFSEAIKDEREKCAKLIDDHDEGFKVSSGERFLTARSEGNRSGLAYAAAIRAMGDKGNG